MGSTEELATVMSVEETKQNLHDPGSLRRALDMAAGAGFDRWNIDLMHGLPGQTAELAQADLEGAIALSAGQLRSAQTNCA